MGTPIYIPQNDLHDALIILNIHNWGKFFSKKFANQLRLPLAKVRPGGRVGVKIFFCVFHPFLNSPQNSKYFQYRHIGSNKKSYPCRMPKTKPPALRAPTNPLLRTTILGSVEGGSPPPVGVGSWLGATPVGTSWRTDVGDFVVRCVW